MSFPGSQPPAAMVVPAFFVKQRITVMVNRYEIRAANPDGSEGQLLALAEQRRMKIKEEVNFFSDESKTRRVISSATSGGTISCQPVSSVGIRRSTSRLRIGR